jgi:hypothetical protein
MLSRVKDQTTRVPGVDRSSDLPCCVAIELEKVTYESMLIILRYLIKMP